MDGHRAMQKHIVFEWPRAMQKRIELFQRNVAQCHGAGFRFVGPLYAASDNNINTNKVTINTDKHK